MFFQYSKFLGEKSLFLGEKVHSERDFIVRKIHRAEKSTEEQRTVQYSRVEQTRAEKKRKE